MTTPLTGNRLAIAGTDEGLASPATQAKPWIPASCETSLFDKGSYSALAFALKVDDGRLAVYDTLSIKELWSFEQNVPFLTAVARAGYRAR